MKKNTYAILLAFSMGLSLFGGINCSGKEQEKKGLYEEYTDIIPQEATEYAKKRFDNMTKTVAKERDEFGVNVYDSAVLEMEKPFIIYSSAGMGTQEPIYYYPVSKGNQIIMVLYVIDQNEDYTVGITTELAEEINILGIDKYDDYIFYEDGDSIIAENYGKEVTVAELSTNDKVEFKNEEENIEKFKKLTVEEKIKVITDTYGDGNEEYVEENQNNLEGAKGFSQKGGGVVRLNTSGCLVQQYYNDCWAASVATTLRYLNYKKYKTLTAEQVCQKMNIGYNDGGTREDKIRALKKYGVESYKYDLDYQISFGQTQTNILDQKPVLMSAATKDNNSWHATTIVGYTTYGGIEQITFHNSGTNKVTSVEYKQEGTSFAYNNKSFIWVGTVCAKN